MSHTAFTSPPVWLALAFVAAGVVTALGTGLVRRYSIARRILDVPNHRSSHSIPTPRGGGLAIAVVLFVGIVVAHVAGLLPARIAVAFLGGGLVIAAIGWRDDHVRIPAEYRALAHFAAAIWAVACVGGFPALHVGTEVHRLGFAGGILAVVGTVWCINLYNFMDGIDGIAAANALVVAAAGALLLLRAGDVGLALVATLLAGASLGFLVWNWPPARIFMGDVGSGLLGFMFAVLALSAERREGPALLLWVLLLAVFAVDATLTLGRRVLRGERWYDAHRSHAYQRAVQYGHSHRTVTLVVVVLDLALGATALAIAPSPQRIPIALVATTAVLLLIYGGVERARPMDAPER